MARIRTIKPEFPQSESIGRVSRDARLLFIELWTIADDSGRTRGSSRMLASLLFPYDEDAPSLIEDWLAELDREGCVTRYLHDGQTYLEICNWRAHQKIDKPSASKLPAFDESSRIFSKPRERSSEDQGPRTKEGTKDRTKEKRRISACAVAPKERDLIRDAIAESFSAKVPEYASPAKENANLVRLSSAVRRKAESSGIDPPMAAQRMVETFWRLHESGKPFYADFTPSKMLAAFEPIWAEVAKVAEASDMSWFDAAGVG